MEEINYSAPRCLQLQALGVVVALLPANRLDSQMIAQAKGGEISFVSKSLLAIRLPLV